MVAYSFRPRFVEPIFDGTKGGTIRAARRAANRGMHSTARAVFGGHAYPGEELQLYTGMRTKHCRLIARKQCLAVEPVELNFELRRVLLADDVRMLSLDRPRDLDAFARFDGFADFDEMTVFWRDEGQVFEGWHIRWLPLPEALR